MHSYGLFSASEKNIQQHKPIPLQNVKVSAKVIDVISEVTIYQTYKYAESNQSQAIYKFPILPSSAFCDFEVKVDDREIKGIVEEAEQATKEYEEALKNGNIACTIEDQSPDLFYCFVGTILPGQTIEIKLIYVSELQQDTKSEGIRFTLPTAIAPKYNHYSLEKQLEGKNFELENNLNECELESCKIEISVTCRMTSVITSIESPTHATISEVDTNNVRLARVDLNEKIGYLENDFVLVFSSQGLDKPRALVEYNSSTDTNCVMLTLVPQCVPYTGETEFIFIVDVQTLRKCMKALELAIYSLPENSLFNIISQNTYLFPDESQQYSQSTFNAAIEFIQSQQINPNEFTLHSTLQSIFGISDKRSNIPKKIFYITNSYLIIHQFEQLVELFQQQRTINDVSNFFTLFIGDDNSNDICNSFESLTKLGKGYSTFTKCNDAFEINLISIVKNSLEIPLTDYEFHLEDPENIESSHHLDNSTYIIPNNEDYVEDNHEESSHQLDNSIFLIPNISHNNNHQRPELQQVPAEIPLIYNKQNSVVYFLLEKGIKPPKVISVKAKFQQDLVQFHVTLDPRALKLKFIHTLAAKKFIEENQGKPSVGSNPKIKDQVISLGKMYNLISTYTSFLAINKRGESSTSKEFNNHPISIFHYHKPNYNSSTYFNFKDFTKKNFPPSYTPISTSSELIDLKNLNIHSGLLSRCTDNLTNLISNPVLFVKDSVDEVMNKYSDEKLTLGIRHKHPIYYLGNGMVNSGSAAYQVARKFERFPIFGGLFVKPVVRFIDESVVKKSREELSVEEFDKHFKENLFESHEEMVNPRVVHVETLFSFLKLFSFDGTILDESRFYEFFGKGNSSVLDQMNLTVDDDDVECWLIAISLAYFEIVLWEEFKEESIMCYHKSEKALKQMIKVEDYEDFDEKYNELLEKAREWIKLWIDNVYWH
ncbi:9214_t:CDS:2 [Funneliformis caledonium]|uniref:9214_t:CDS:1 n=1 Tax=Funneliformis caledonium TaxID=1117310 RepID=A0A9N9FAF5_9GLOM|nr:9214_t:CDS:2 [Funneliformis caledonium]